MTAQLTGDPRTLRATVTYLRAYRAECRANLRILTEDMATTAAPTSEQILALGIAKGQVGAITTAIDDLTVALNAIATLDNA